MQCLIADCEEPAVQRRACRAHREMLDRVALELKGRRAQAVVKRKIEPTPRSVAPPDFALKIARVVHQRGSVTTTEIAEIFGVSKRTATRHIGKARAEGWILPSGRVGVRVGPVTPHARGG